MLNLSVDTLSSYVMLYTVLRGTSGKLVMIPETYEENPFRDQGKVLTQAIIDEG